MISFVLLAILASARGSVDEYPYNSILSLQPDDSVSPCEDFFKYVNGKWLEATSIPPSIISVGGLSSQYYQVKDKGQDLMNEIVAGGPYEQGSDEQIVHDMYQSFIDTEQRDAHGMSDLKSNLAIIDKVNTKEEYMRLLANQNNTFDDPLSWRADPSCKNARENILIVSPGAFYATSFDGEDDKSADIRNAHKELLQRISDYLGESWNVTALYELIASINRILPLSTDSLVDNLCNLVSLEELSNIAPDMYFSEAASEFGVRGLENKVLGVEYPEYFERLNEIFKSVDLETWKAYSKIRHCLKIQSLISKDFNDLFLDYNRLTSGVEKAAPAEDRAIYTLSQWEPFGRLYAKKYFSEESKAQVKEMVGNIMLVLRKRLVDNPWMKMTTKLEALLKLRAMSTNIGYPDKWFDFSDLKITPGRLYANKQAYDIFWQKILFSGLYKPVDLDYWLGITPASSSGYYTPDTNSITLPAGVLSPPLFDSKASDASNYGGIGFIIGHEIIHGFDTTGARYDGDGNVKFWWDQEDYKAFQSLDSQLREQFNQYEASPGLFVNGESTAGENIADLGGVTIAYQAFKKYGKKNSSRDSSWTEDQEFFISLATMFGVKIRPEYISSMLEKDPHSPPKFRVNGPLSNFMEFDKVFSCNGTGMMYPPDKRIVIY